MATIRLPPDFKEFLRLLHSHEVQYLIVGGYAVGYHGYPRATGDLDLWIAISPGNASRLVEVLDEFGFGSAGITAELFEQEGRVLRLGVPPVRIEILTSISGVDFPACYRRRIVDEIDGVLVSLIDLENLKQNKQASGRLKGLSDLENLP
jgi:hypothetical protein